MQTNTKQTPKSCSCQWCRRGKSSRFGKSMMKQDERGNRRFVTNILNQIKDVDFETEEDVYLIHKGNYYD